MTKAPPTARAELDGVKLRLWVATGGAASALAAQGAEGPLYIADGHHRFETAAAYARENPTASRLVAFVVSARDPGLAVLPTHRVIYGPSPDQPALLEGWRRWFDAGRVAPCADRIERLAQLGQGGTACLVAWPDAKDLSLVLKADAPLDDVARLGRTEAVRALDVARVEALVVWPILASGGATPLVNYTPDPHVAFERVRKGGAAAAVLLNPPTVEQIFAVADAGDVMPPKSTYFIPKVPSGLVLNPLA